jgi:hypothetical protein
VNGRPEAIESIYIMKSPGIDLWDGKIGKQTV